MTEETPILIQQINAEELKTIFDDDALTTFLFPSGYMVAFRVPFQPIISNIPKIMHFRSLLLKSNPSVNTESTLLSYGTYYCCKNEHLYYSLDLYGNLKTDTLRDHIDIHLTRLTCVTGQNTTIFLSVNVDENKDITKLQDIVRTYGFKYHLSRVGIITDQNLRTMFN